MAKKQTGKKKNKSAKRGTAENPFRMDYNIVELSGINHFRAFVIESQQRKDGPWTFEEAFDTRKNAEREFDAYIKESIEIQEFEWRRRHGLIVGTNVQRITFDSGTSQDQLEKQIVELRARYKKIIDASANGKKIKPFLPRKYPRFRLVERTAVVTNNQTVIVERGLQDNPPTVESPVIKKG